MNKNQSTNRIGHSDQKRFTPQGQKNLALSDVSGQIACQLTGPGITRPTTIYVWPHRIEQTVAKYAELGQILRGPGVGISGPVQTVLDMLPPRRDVARNAKAVICLNTGQFFTSVDESARAFHLSKQTVGNHLRGKSKHANGRRYRWATPEEIRAAVNPAWKFTGPLLPLLPKGTRNI